MVAVKGVEFLRIGLAIHDVGAADYQPVDGTDGMEVLIVVGNDLEQMPQGIQSRPFFVIGFDHRPRRISGICMENMVSLARV